MKGTMDLTLCPSVCNTIFLPLVTFFLIFVRNKGSVDINWRSSFFSKILVVPEIVVFVGPKLTFLNFESVNCTFLRL